MATTYKVRKTTASGSIKEIDVTTLEGSNVGLVASANGVSVVQYVNGAFVTLDFTLVNTPVTLVKATTVSGGGGTTLFTFGQGIVQPVGGSSNLTIVGADDKSFLAGVGSVAADTGTTLTGTEISFLPQTAATTSGAGHSGTCKMKSTVTIPTPGSKLDGTSTAVAIILNACLASDATGVEALTFSGTIRINCVLDGDN